MLESPEAIQNAKPRLHVKDLFKHSALKLFTAGILDIEKKITWGEIDTKNEHVRLGGDDFYMLDIGTARICTERKIVFRGFPPPWLHTIFSRKSDQNHVPTDEMRRQSG